MQPDQTTLLSRQQGSLPDKYWYQLNGKSAVENFQEQRENIYAELMEEDDDELIITSEVKVK